MTEKKLFDININNEKINFVSTNNPNNKTDINLKRKMIIKKIDKKNGNKNALNHKSIENANNKNILNLNSLENKNNNYNNIKNIFKRNKISINIKNNLNKELSHKKNNNTEIYNTIKTNINKFSFQNDNNLYRNRITNGTQIENQKYKKINKKIIISLKKTDKSQIVNEPFLDNIEFFNEYNNNFFDNNKSEINRKKNFSNITDEKYKKTNFDNFMNYENIDNNKYHRKSDIDNNIDNYFKYDYLNQNNKKYSENSKNNRNNLNQSLKIKNNIENDKNIEDLLKENNTGKNKSFNIHNNNKNTNKQELNKMKFINKSNQKHNGISKVETNDNLIITQNNYINKNVINIYNNNNSNNPIIFDVQNSISARTQKRNNIKGDKGSIIQMRKLLNSLNKQKMNNNQNYLNQINNNIRNNNNNKYNEKI